MSKISTEEAIFEPPPEDLKHRVAGAVAVTAVAQIVKIALQFAALIILARLLTPDDFGVVAMAGPVIAFLAILQDLGLSQATIQRPSLTQRQASTLFWLNVAAGTMVCFLIVISAPLVGRFYDDERVTLLLWASGPLVMFSCLYTQHMALLARQMRFRDLAIIEGTAATFAFCVAVGAAFVLRDFWATFAYSLALALSTAIGAITITRWRPSRPKRDPHFREMLHFGTGVTGFNLANFLARNLDNVLIGKAWGSVHLGLYDRAYKLLLFPLQQVNGPVQRVMTPALSSMLEQPDRYRHAYIRVVGLMAMTTAPGILVASICSDWIIALLLGPRWMGVAPIFQALSFAGLVQIFNNPIGWLFVTQGRTSELARWGMFSALTCAAAFAVGLPWGSVGVAISYAASELVVRTPALWWYIGRRGAVRASDIIRMVLPFTLASAFAALPVFAIRLTWRHDLLLGVVIATAIGYSIFWLALGCLPAGRVYWKEGRSLLLPFLARRIGRFNDAA